MSREVRALGFDRANLKAESDFMPMPPMANSFANAPLAEIIAELRWQAQGAFKMPPHPGATVQVPIGTGADNSAEEFYMNFAAAIYQHGFQRSERVIPVGVPVPLHQIALRLKKEGSADLFQVGPGIFAANALPPYRSWDQFSPVVKVGLERLLAARTTTEADLPFDSITLRYINAFNLSHTGGMPLRSFLREILGFGVKVPKVLSDQAIETQLKVGIAIQFDLAEELVMTVQIAEATVKNQESLLYDVTVASKIPIAPDVENLMAVLNKARAVIHKTFYSLIDPIKEQLQPVET